MKVRASVRKMCAKCRIIRRRGVVRVICDNPKHKYHQDSIFVLRRLALTVEHDSDSPYLISALSAGVPVLRVDRQHSPPTDLIIKTTGGDPVSGVVRGAGCVVGRGLLYGLVLDG